MYAKESQHQKVIFTFFEKMALVTLDLLQKGQDNIFFSSYHISSNFIGYCRSYYPLIETL